MQPGSPYPPQPGYPPGYPQPGYQQSPYPGPPKPRAGLVAVIIVAVAVLVVGGGTAAFLAFGTRSDAVQPAPVPVAPVQSSAAKPAAAPGRYRTAPVACAALDLPPYTFTTEFPATLDYNEYWEDCKAVLGTETNDGSAEVTIQRDLGSGGIATAQDAMTAEGQPMSADGFENPPNASYQSDFGECTLEYVRSNEYVSAEFTGLPGVQDLASCEQVGLPYLQKLYAVIG